MSKGQVGAAASCSAGRPRGENPRSELGACTCNPSTSFVSVVSSREHRKTGCKPCKLRATAELASQRPLRQQRPLHKAH